MKKVHDYQEETQQWRKYDPSEEQLRERYEYYVYTQTAFAEFPVLGYEAWRYRYAEYPGVLLKALEAWMLQQGVTREAFKRSISWMTVDPGVPLFETGTAEDRRVEIRW